MVLILLAIACLFGQATYSLNITSSDFIPLNISDTIYCLSKDGIYTYSEAKSNCGKIKAELAFFDNNEEYLRVFKTLSKNVSLLKETWIDFNSTISVTSFNYNGYKFSWRNEAFNGSVWSAKEPDWNCQFTTTQCCARISPNMGLQDKECDFQYSYLCKALPRCPLHAVGCILNCGEPITHLDCVAGYYFKPTAESCDDVDECKLNSSRCQQTCHNTVGSYTCGCDSGYILGNNNFTCEDVNECSLNNGSCQQLCENFGGGFRCQCYLGFTPRLGNNSVLCDDIDECKQNTTRCQHMCVNTMGSFSCECRAGFLIGIDCYTCDDINECLSNNSSCQHICENLEGSFHCKCDPGYSLAYDNKTCDDVDECSLRPQLCQQMCNNTNGSYTCGCQEGFSLSTNGHNCSKVENCITAQCQHICFNTSTSYTCQCYPGYALDADGTHCNYVGECEISVCPNCFSKNISRQCLHYCNSTSITCDHDCVTVNGSYQCSCSSGFYLNLSDHQTCHDIDECSLNSNLCEVYCNNTPGTYYCSCPPGYHLSENKYSCEKTSLNNYCPCSCSYSKVKTLRNKEQMSLYLDILRKSLQVNKSNLLSSRLKLTSQEDKNPANDVIGYVGVTFVVIVLGTVLFIDMTRLISYMVKLMKHNSTL